MEGAVEVVAVSISFLWRMHSFSCVHGFPMRFFTRLRVLTKHPRVLAPNDITSQLFVATHIVLSYTRCSLLSYFPLLHPYEGKRHNIKTSRDDDGDDTRDTGWMTATGRKGSGTLCI